MSNEPLTAKEEAVAALLEFSKTQDEADGYVDKLLPNASYAEKINFLNRAHKVKILARCTPENLSVSEIEKENYYAMLDTIINMRWR